MFARLYQVTKSSARVECSVVAAPICRLHQSRSADCIIRLSRYSPDVAHVSAAERRPQLIRAAIDLMTREGVAAGSTRAIAAELGVAQATVHYTFGTKEELYRAVMAQLTQDLVTQVEQAAPHDAGFEETVSTLAAALWRTVRDQPSSHQLLTELTMFALRTPHLAEALTSHVGGAIEVTARLIEEAAARTGRKLAQPADTLARFFLAGFDGLTTQRLSLPDEEAEFACLQALVSAVVALAGGRLNLVAVPRT
jgi:AcrR family transcriptional regulator